MTAVLDRAPPPAAPASAPAATGCATEPWHCAFAINGRFLTQPVTGVQRYGREILRAMDADLGDRGGRVSVIVPAGCEPDAGLALEAVTFRPRGLGRGPLWEQAILPFCADAPLLHLCNMAPALSRGHVVCLHDANVFIAPGSYGFAFRTLYRVLQPLVARRALAVATVSETAAAQLGRHLGIAAGRIHVLPNGHEHALRWSAARATVFADRPPRRPYVLLLGSRAPHKNIGRIVHLAEALDALGLDILVAGGGAPVFAGVELRPAPNVVWLGRVSDDDLARLFDEALCLAFPSLTEGFGLPLVEAMARGCPIVTSDRASLPEVCGDAALLADPLDDALWLRHVRALAGSRHLAEELRGRGRARVKRFSWASSARGYLDLFGH